MTKLVWFICGKDAEIQPIFMFLNKSDRNYPITGRLDEVEGISYLTGPSRLIYKTILLQWMKDIKVMWKRHNSELQSLFSITEVVTTRKK